MIVRSHGGGSLAVVDALVRWNSQIEPALRREKYRRMREDLFAFFRGTNHLFADDWVDLRPADPGPPTWVCGDLHPKNLGCFRADDGATVFDINDFDEAIVAPCGLDLVRCATGILLAGEIWKHSPVRAMRMVLAFLDGYRAGVLAMTRRARRGASSRRDPAAVLALKAERKGPISGLIARSGARTQADLLGRVTRARPGGLALKRSRRFFEVAPGVARAVAQAVGTYAAGRGEAGGFEVVDVARRVAGIGSLGVRRYAALVAGDGTPAGHRLFDIKEAAPPSLREFAGPQGFLDAGSPAQARRIVDAQRLIQERPTAGLDVLDVGGVGCRIRELVPEENRARLDRFHRDTSKLRRGLDHAGWIAAHAHIRGAGGDAARVAELAEWAAGAALDAVLASAVRFADRNHRHYKAFRRARLDEAPAG